MLGDSDFGLVVGKQKERRPAVVSRLQHEHIDTHLCPLGGRKEKRPSQRALT